MYAADPGIVFRLPDSPTMVMRSRSRVSFGVGLMLIVAELPVFPGLLTEGLFAAVWDDADSGDSRMVAVAKTVAIIVAKAVVIRNEPSSRCGADDSVREEGID